MSTIFTPIDEFEVLCRFCEKITVAHLDRCIAGNGKTVDRNSSFEYYCKKCLKTFCFPGTDLLEVNKEEETPSTELRKYTPREHFYLGEVIHHEHFDENGTVVGTNNGTPNKIDVNFPKNGLRKLVQDM